MCWQLPLFTLVIVPPYRHPVFRVRRAIGGRDCNAARELFLPISLAQFWKTAQAAEALTNERQRHLHQESDVFPRGLLRRANPKSFPNRLCLMELHCDAQHILRQRAVAMTRLIASLREQQCRLKVLRERSRVVQQT